MWLGTGAWNRQRIYSGQPSPVSQTRGPRLQGVGLQHGSCNLYPLPLGLVSFMSARVFDSIAFEGRVPWSLLSRESKRMHLSMSLCLHPVILSLSSHSVVNNHAPTASTGPSMWTSAYRLTAGAELRPPHTPGCQKVHAQRTNGETCQKEPEGSLLGFLQGKAGFLCALE